MRSFVLFFLIRAALSAQEMPMQGSGSMPMNMPMNMPGGGQMDPGAQQLMDQASGTSENPEAGSMPMLTRSAGDWRLMLMGQVFAVDTQQTGPRGHDKLYSANWFMGMAQHRLGPGTFQFETMLSLEPATVTKRSYPLLFQTGETAYGKPLVDAQHPHDLIMSLGFEYALPLTESTTFEIYYAPVGDPALGPVAFPHRTSASEIPQAPLGHHWQDSTHIADDVVTAAIKYRWARLEASGFYGSEPDENRWNIDWGPINSWATRFSVIPNDRWMAQVSVGRLSRPERQTPGDVVRTTASLSYSRPINHATWASSFIWGRNHEILDHRNLNSYLLESVLPVSHRNLITGRAELVDKDELFADTPSLAEQLARTAGSTFRIGAYTIGYTRELGTYAHIASALGMNVSLYTLPDDIKPYYGDHPRGVNVFARFRLK